MFPLVKAAYEIIFDYLQKNHFINRQKFSDPCSQAVFFAPTFYATVRMDSPTLVYILCASYSEVFMNDLSFSTTG